MVHLHKQIYLLMCNALRGVCDEISIPMAPDKAVGPLQMIEILGLLLDTLLMVVRTPEDKLQNISAILVSMIKNRKATTAVLESLVVRLNFRSKVVPVGRTFIRRIYDSSTGVPSHYHTELKSTVLAYL